MNMNIGIKPNQWIDQLHRRLGRLYHKYYRSLPYKIQYLKVLKQNKFKAKTVIFYPEVPISIDVIYKMCCISGYRITGKRKPGHDLIINYEDTTFRCNDDVLMRLSREHTIINYKCPDISKKKVDETFTKVFGYSPTINPLTYQGRCVKKSNTNGLHDGKIITCPIDKTEEGYVYQIIINNQLDEEMVLDIRAPVFKNTIPFLYLKKRSINTRFSNTNTIVEMAEVDEMLSQEEVEKIIAFCKEIGLDWGELDILRNRDDGRIYILDVNNTPAGPPNHISKEGKALALKRLSSTFEKVFL